MSDTKTREYEIRVSNILKVFTDKYGRGADLVNINSQTIGSPTYNIMKTILEQRSIAIEIDDRVAVGQFMFVNRELAASNML